MIRTRQVVIVGAGVGGLCAAIALRRCGLGVVVLEQAAELREVGAGVLLWPNAMRVLQRLEVGSAVEQAGAVAAAQRTLRSARGTPLGAGLAEQAVARLAAPTVVVHRGLLQAILLAALDRGVLRLGAECVGVAQDAGGVTVHLADGSTEHGDLAVGADGLHSRVRAVLVGDGPPRYSGYTAWRGVVPLDRSLADRLHPGESWSRGCLFGVARLGGNQAYCWASARTAERTGGSPAEEKATVERRFGVWHDPIPELIDATLEQAIVRSRLYDRPPLRSWSVGRVGLLAYAADRAAGKLRVLWGFGVESESELPFAALHQFARPVLDHVDRLPGPQAAALRGAFGLATAHGDDRFLIGVGVLGLLAEVAEERPLICLVDDAQWLDQPSADALTFAGRRLEAEGVVLLFAARDDDVHAFTAPGFQELRLGGLDADAAGALLTERFPAGLARDVRDRLIQATQGNPLVLVELPASLDADRLAGRAPLPDPLPASVGIERVFLERVRRLPESTRTLVLAAAAEETGDPAVIFRAARALGVDAPAFGVAEEAGLLRIAEGRIWFHHPLVRSAVYRGATFSQRQAIHQALAAALLGEEHADRRAWHRAAAAMEPDPEVADELERSAERARRRSGYAAAARALERSAELTAAEELRSRRLGDAADAAWLAGQPDRALGLLDRAAGGDSAPRLRADIAHLRGVIELQRGVPADAFTILTAGSAEVAPVDPVKALAMLLPASEAASYAGDVALTVEAARRAAALPRGERRIDQFTLGLLVGIGSILEGDSARGAPLLREAVVLAQAFDDPSRLGFAGAAARYLGDDMATHDFYARAVARARANGELVLLPYLLESLAVAEVAAGRYTAATASASEGLGLARETGQDSSVCRNLSTLALLAAMLEDEKAFNTVGRLVQQEDYALRLLRDAGLPTPAPYGVVELTPEREYLITFEFFGGAVELGEAEVDEAIIDDGLGIIRKLWHAGLAHRDIKPANLLVRDGRILLIDVAFVQAHPSPWRQAVDLANMMLCLALRSDPELVYDRALRLFTVEEITEAFAATRGLTMPSQLRNLMRAQGRDLHTEFLRLLPERPRPIAIQRWSVRRVGLALLTLLLAAVVFNIAWGLLIGDGGVENDPIEARTLRCAPHEPLLLMAQSVPTASLVPCVENLPAGWSLGDTVVGNDRSRFTLTSDRGGVLVVELTASCDLARAAELTSERPGARRYLRLERTAAGVAMTRAYTFPSGCVTQHLVAPAASQQQLANEASFALGFTARDALAAAVRRDSRGRLELDAATR